MGNGRIDTVQADFLIVGKQVLDWIPDSSVCFHHI